LLLKLANPFYTGLEDGNYLGLWILAADVAGKGYLVSWPYNSSRSGRENGTGKLVTLSSFYNTQLPPCGTATLSTPGGFV
jgi:hypothetical protein